MALYGFGNNWAGQLGFENNETFEPNRLFIGSFEHVRTSRIHGGMQHSLFLEDLSGTVFTAGQPRDGALGLGSQITTLTVPFFSQIVDVVERDSDQEAEVRQVSIRTARIIDVCSGWNHICFIREGTKTAVFCSGKNDQGQLGNTAVSERTLTPIGVIGDTEFASKKFVKITCGADHTVATAADGTVWAWGSGEEGSLGNGKTSASQKPVKVTLPASVVPQDIACGFRFCALRTPRGVLWGWGSNEFSQLSRPSSMAKLPTPEIIYEQGVQQIAAGGYHILAVVDGKLWSCGSGTLGQTGHPLPHAPTIKKSWTQDKLAPVASMHRVNIQSISAGIKHSLALDTCGNVYAFGSDAFGQLGVGYLGLNADFRSLNPQSIEKVRSWNLDVVGVSAVGYHSFITVKERKRVLPGL